MAGQQKNLSSISDRTICEVDSMTQSERILRHLREVGPITWAQAASEYGIAHLASRISELRAAGHPITSRPVKSKNRYGEIVHFSEYRLEDMNA